MTKSVIIYSGGMDSFTLLNELIRNNVGEKIYPITFDYGQRHNKEIGYARYFCSMHGLEHKLINMSEIGSELLSGSSQTSDIPVPEGHYEDASMKLTVVPNRNMIMLSLAIGYAISIGADRVYFGAHAGDHAIYPDCRPEFVAAMDAVAALCDYTKVAIYAPYLSMTKGEIASVGANMKLNYGESWTCYNGRGKACGKCGACQERIEAMAFANIIDPMEYE